MSFVSILTIICAPLLIVLEASAYLKTYKDIMIAGRSVNTRKRIKRAQFASMLEADLGNTFSDAVEDARHLSFERPLHVTPGSKRQLVVLELVDQCVALPIAFNDGRLLLYLSINSNVSKQIRENEEPS